MNKEVMKEKFSAIMIKLRRKSQFTSRAKLSDVAGFSSDALQAWEEARSLPDFENIINLVMVFDWPFIEDLCVEFGVKLPKTIKKKDAYEVARDITAANRVITECYTQLLERGDIGQLGGYKNVDAAIHTFETAAETLLGHAQLLREKKNFNNN